MRTVLRVLIPVICIALLAFPVSNAFATVYDGKLQVPRVEEAPEIDGELDEMWYNVTATKLLKVTDHTADYLPEDWQDAWGTYRVMWDEDNLYFYLNMQDDVKFIPADGNPWDQDNVEIFFDSDNSKNDQATSYDSCDVQWRWVRDRIDDNVNDATGGPGDYVFMDTDSGYTFELAIPVDSLEALISFDLAEGHVFGWEVQVSDKDTSATDTNSTGLKWWTTSNFGWNDPSSFGTAVLTDREVSEILDVGYTEDAPEIDGEMDEIWEEYPEISTNTHTDGFDYTTAVDWYDSQVSYRTMYNDAAFYLLVEVTDDIKYMPVGGNPWDMDNVEIFFDSDNSKNDQTTSYDSCDVQWRWVRDEVYDSTNTATAGPGEFVFMDTDDGYIFELAIPADSLSSLISFDLSGGHLFGWEIQVSDKDTVSVDTGLVTNSTGMKWWSSSNFGWNDPSSFGTARLIGTTSIDNDHGIVVATEHSLSQNYPNPFNPSTTIEYKLDTAGDIRVVIYNVVGEEVATLVNEYKVAGQHLVSFDASKLSSGMYLYRLETGTSMLTKKMLLLK